MSQTLWRSFIENEAPLFSFKLTDRQTGNVLDLTSVTSIGIKTWFKGETSLIINGSCTIDSDPTTGLCSYQTSSTNLTRVGAHEGILQLNYSGGEIRIVKFALQVLQGAPA